MLQLNELSLAQAMLRKDKLLIKNMYNKDKNNLSLLYYLPFFDEDIVLFDNIDIDYIITEAYNIYNATDLEEKMVKNLMFLTKQNLPKNINSLKILIDYSRKYHLFLYTTILLNQWNLLIHENF